MTACSAGRRPPRGDPFFESVFRAWSIGSRYHSGRVPGGEQRASRPPRRAPRPSQGHHTGTARRSAELAARAREKTRTGAARTWVGDGGAAHADAQLAAQRPVGVALPHRFFAPAAEPRLARARG